MAPAPALDLMVMRRRFVPWLGAAVAAAVMVLALPVTGSAMVAEHALPIHEVPAQNSTVQAAPTTVVITFGEIPDPTESGINVVNTSGTSFTAGPTRAVPGDPAELEVALKPLPKGVYTVQWHTLSTVDGHFVSGSYAFGVQVAVTGAAATASTTAPVAPLTAEQVVMRLLLYAGLMLVVGCATIDVIALRQRTALLRLLATLGTAVAAVGAIGVVDAQRAAAGLGWGAALSSSLARPLVWRSLTAGVMVLLAAATWGARTRDRLQVWLMSGLGVAALAGMLVDAVFSHAGAENPAWLNIGVQWIHIAGAGVWIGGLGALLLTLRGNHEPGIRGTAAGRYSTLAGVALVVVGASGLWRAIVEVGTWSALTSTGFGLLVLLKSGLLVLLAILGAINRYRSLPRIHLSLRRLRTVGSTEMVLATAAVLAAAALVNLTPPVEAAASSTAAPPLTVCGHDFATTVKLCLAASPGHTGVNTFTATVDGYDSGSPVNASGVQLTFSLPALPAVGQSTLDLARSGPGTFSATGAQMGIPGTWTVVALVDDGSRSTEVTLHLTPHTTPPHVSCERFAGEPTLCTISVQSGQTIQVYLDPDRPGNNLFHVTFFAQGGTSQIPVTTLTVIERSSGRSPQTLPVTELDAGHFTASATVPAAGATFEIFGSTASGNEYVTSVTMIPQ